MEIGRLSFSGLGDLIGLSRAVADILKLKPLENIYITFFTIPVFSGLKQNLLAKNVVYLLLFLLYLTPSFALKTCFHEPRSQKTYTLFHYL